MTKAELIKALEQYPDDKLVCIWDTELESIDEVDSVAVRDIGEFESNSDDAKGNVIMLFNKNMLEYHSI